MIQAVVCTRVTTFWLGLPVLPLVIVVKTSPLGLSQWPGTDHGSALLHQTLLTFADEIYVGSKQMYLNEYKQDKELD